MKTILVGTAVFGCIRGPSGTGCDLGIEDSETVRFSGFYAVERDAEQAWRWTNGEGRIRVQKLDLGGGECYLRLLGWVPGGYQLRPRRRGARAHRSRPQDSPAGNRAGRLRACDPLDHLRPRRGRRQRRSAFARRDGHRRHGALLGLVSLTSHRPPAGSGRWSYFRCRRSALETKQLRRSVHPSVRALETAIREFIDASNTAGQPYVWTKTADEILTSIARFALRTADVHDRQNVMSRTTGTGH